jgi:AcrR family transcriptional regulator
MSLRERKKQQARVDILETASELITRKGYDDTTMKDIAGAAGMSYQTLYNYFPNKALIVQALLTADTARISDRMEKVFEEPADHLLKRFNQAVKVLFDAVAHRDRQLWREVIALSIKLAPEVYGVHTPFYEIAQARLDKALSDAQQDGTLDPYVDVELMGQTIYGIIDLAFLMYIMEPTLSRVAVIQKVRDQLGLLVKPYLRTD